MRPRTKLLLAAAILAACLGVVVVFIAIEFLVDSAPPEDGDLTPRRAEVPTAENGFELVNVGKDAITEDDYELYAGLGFFGEEWSAEEARKRIARYAHLLAKYDESFGRPTFQLPEVIDLEQRMPYLLGWRALMSVASDRLRLLVEEGETRAACEEAMKQVEFGRRIDRGGGVLVTYLVGIAIESIGFGNTYDILQHASPDPDQLRRMIERLGTREPDARGFQEALRGEYVVDSRAIDGLLEGRYPEIQPQGAARPLMILFLPNETRELFAGGMRTLIENLEKLPGERVSLDLEAQKPTKGSFRNAPGRYIYISVMGTLEDSIGEYDALRFYHAATTALLALRCHQLEHGDLPPSLGALVPEYLPRVPLDPYDGRPLRYSRERKLLWAVGNDLVDDGGDEEGLEEDGDGWGRNREEPTVRIPF